MNKELNYTREAWKVDGSTVYALNAKGTNIFYAGFQSGNTDQDERTSEEVLIANARLASVAPLMYEALKYIIRELDKADIIKANSIFMEMPNRAIAKAEGK